MYSLLSRANAVFAFTLSVLSCLTFCLFLSNCTKDFSTPIDISVSKSIVYSPPRDNSDLGIVSFNVQADLSSLFDWNTKQLFLFLLAEYETDSNSLNQVSMWDKIVLRGDNPVIDIRDGQQKYYFWDDGTGLRGSNVTLTLHWNVVPNSGRLQMLGGSGSGSHSFRFPADYTKNRF